MEPTAPMESVMVRNVVIVEPEASVAESESDLRTFDALPVNSNPHGVSRWGMVRWVDIADFLDSAESIEERRARTARRVCDLIADHIVPVLRVPIVAPDTPAVDVLPLIRRDTVLVVEPESGQLVGLLEPADFPRLWRKLREAGPR